MNEKKVASAILKIIIFIAIIAIVVIAVMAIKDKESTETVGNEQTKQTSGSSTGEIKELIIGETWTVEGQWSLTINSIKTTTERNEFSDKTPGQVIYVTYTYENLGYEDKNGIMNGLYFDLEPNVDAIVVDGNGEMAYSYPNYITTYPTETPVGAKCVNAQTCIGLNNKSKTITMNITKYDGKGKRQKVKYTLSID